MLLFILLGKKAEYLNCAKLIVKRLIVKNPIVPVQICSVNIDNIVYNEPEFAEPPNISLLNYIDNLIVESSGSDSSAAVETALSVGFRAMLGIVTNFIEKRKNELMAASAINKTTKIKSKHTPAPIEVIIFTDLKNGQLSEKLSSKLMDLFKMNKIVFYIFSENISYSLRENILDEDLVIDKIIENDSFMLPSELFDEFITLRRLISNTGAFIGNVKFGASFYENIKFRKLPQAWNANLRIGSNISIPIVGYRKSVSYEEPKWFNHKRPHENDMDDDEEVGFEGDFKEEGIKKLYDVHFTKYGETFLTKEEKKAHKPKTDRCMDLLFTMDADDVREIHHEKPVYFIKPNYKNEKSIKAFNAFRNALIKQNLVGVARKCYNKNTYPKLVILRPYIGVNSILESFQLPFKDNIVNPLDYIMDNGQIGYLNLWKTPTSSSSPSFDDDNNVKINTEIKKVVGEYLKCLTINDNDSRQMLPPQLQFNPKLDYMYKKILERASTSEFNTNDLPHVKTLRPEHLNIRGATALEQLIVKI